MVVCVSVIGRLCSSQDVLPESPAPQPGSKLLKENLSKLDRLERRLTGGGLESPSAVHRPRVPPCSRSRPTAASRPAKCTRQLVKKKCIWTFETTCLVENMGENINMRKEVYAHPWPRCKTSRGITKENGICTLVMLKRLSCIFIALPTLRSIRSSSVTYHMS